MAKATKGKASVDLQRVLYVVTVSGQIVEQRLPAKASLSTLQALVEGMIEPVKAGPRAEAGFAGCNVWANEEGLVRGLPFNPVASLLVQRPLVGNVVVEPRTAAGSKKFRDHVGKCGGEIQTVIIPTQEVQ